MQYDDRTSSLGRGIGAVTGTSPVNVDHLLRGYFGTAGQGVNDKLTDAARGLGIDDRGPAAMDTDRGFTGSFSTDPLATPQPSLDVLESDRNIAKLQRVSEHLLQTGQYDKLAPWFQQHAEPRWAPGNSPSRWPSSSAPSPGGAPDRTAKGMPPAQKQAQIKQIRDAQYQLAKLTVQ
jgi:hypothetical protein